MATIQVKNLKKSYEYYKKQPGLLASIRSLFHRETLYAEALKGINLEIAEGELVGFIGPNGAGKTTTLKIFAGLLTPSFGEVSILGYDPWKREADYQKQFALVMGQKNQLWWDLPAMESFILNKEIYEISDEVFEKNLEELITVLDIKDILDIQVRKLSLGQRMKCELVAALLHNPKVLFLDEPTIGLDVVAQKNIRDFIKKYNKTHKTTIILTSHYMEDIKELCKRVVIIDHGKIVYDGLLEKLIMQYAPYKLLTITFNGNGVTREDIAKYGEIDQFEQYKVSLKVSREQTKKIASEILNSNLPVDDILIDEVEIQDVIRKMF